jgi:hypothetical protein
VDVFRFSRAGALASINGGGAPANQGDWLDYSSFRTPVTVNLASGTGTNVTGRAGSVSNIQNVRGGNARDTLTGNALVQVSHISRVSLAYTLMPESATSRCSKSIVLELRSGK